MKKYLIVWTTIDGSSETTLFVSDESIEKIKTDIKTGITFPTELFYMYSLIEIFELSGAYEQIDVDDLRVCKTCGKEEKCTPCEK